MPRSVLSEELIHPNAQQTVAVFHEDIVKEVKLAITNYSVVVVGMRHNPVVKSVRSALDAEDITFQYLEYGSYFSQWKRRLSLKMWTGWPTFPMVFHQGVLLGGSQEVKALIATGFFQK